MTTAFLGLHLLLVQRQGMSVPLSDRAAAEGQARSCPADAVLPELRAARRAAGGTSPWRCSRRWRVLAVGAGPKADAFAPVPPGIRPEWYFLAMFQTLKLLPSHILGLEGEVLGVVGFGRGALLLAVPFLDRERPAAASEPLFTRSRSPAWSIWWCSRSSATLPS